MDGPDSRGIYDEHAPALWRYAGLLTGDRARAAYVVGETMRCARRDPDLPDFPAPSVRAWLFSVARNMILDEQRRADASNQIGAPDSEWPEGAEPEVVNAAVDRLLLADAFAQLSTDHRAVIRCAC